MTSGSSRTAIVSASASTSLPSASVLSTSTVLPDKMVRTSPGRIAEPLIMFSASGRYAVTVTGTCSSATDRMAATTAAAPAMSFFCVLIEEPGLIVSPPES